MLIHRVYFGHGGGGFVAFGGLFDDLNLRPLARFKMLAATWVLVFVLNVLVVP